MRFRPVGKIAPSTSSGTGQSAWRAQQREGRERARRPRSYVVERGGDVKRGLITPIDGLEPEEISDEDEALEGAAADGGPPAGGERPASAGGAPKMPEAAERATTAATATTASSGVADHEFDSDADEPVETTEGAENAPAADEATEDTGEPAQDMAAVAQARAFRRKRARTAARL